ncbi:pimeloyl-ACP methyl ester carboxylesterase [Flavobacterium arsenatis]|uniref:Pimeloyl-ACP methyl ester carboxylesterase n=1 Tax=Flavobacterium arsenatis TaxID=1484332 RepID=A0ABU1TR18_9FLAO|nr:T9SS type A sorting domain-containing protein [Flavobacterium arsenatis]MDR6968232.1 pimeloyl-ACP methyl ester carboxylesterase [Flavobacterium arsenatis]
MKKISTLLCVLYAILGHSQQQTNSTQAIIRPIHINNEWKNQVNPIFQGLDKTRVPHGILNDYAMEFTNVPAYNGTLTDSTFIDPNVLGSIYKTLFMGKVTTTTQYFPTIENVANNWATHRRSYNQTEQSTLVLAGLFYQYSRINPQSSSKITVSNNKYYDKFVKSVWQNPYQTMSAIAFTPAINSYNKKSFGVVLPQDLMLSNSSNLIQKIEVNLNDGSGYKLLSINQKIYANYAQNGTYNWVFKTTLTNGTILYSHTKVKIDAPLVLPPPQPMGTNDYANNVFVPHPTNPLFVAQAGAILRIDYAPAHNGQIRKPFIVAEGFDPGSVTEPETEGGERSLNNFLNDQGDLPNSGDLRDLLLFDNTQEYDIIYIDWQNGMHNIKHNSEVLRNVIKWVNAKKLQAGSTEPNVLIGQSMGGLIGRYTLAKMEKDYNEDHDVRLFIAHDSPMQGANTPVSTQYFSRHIYDEYTSAPLLYGFMENVIPSILNFVDLMLSTNLAVKFPSLDDILTIQDTPAAMQMNYHYVDLASDPTTAVHSVWQNEFDAMGYPEESINIAISNGNECAVDHGFGPRAKFISLHDTDNPDFFGDLVHMLITPIIGDQINDFSLAILGTLPGSSKYFYDFDLHANPLTFASERQVYAGKVRYEKKFLWIVKMTHTMMERNKTVPLGYLPFDTYSGGYYDIGNVIEELPFSSNVVVNRRYGFIPVVSALDIRRNNQPVLEVDYLKKYAAGTTPEPALTSGFHAFIVDYTDNFINNEHISFQVRNGNWLAGHLTEELSIPTDCSYMCSTREPNWADSICTSQMFTSPVIISDATYTWSISEGYNLVIGSATNLQSFTVTNRNIGSGYITIDLFVTTLACGTKNFTKRLWVGLPTIRQPLDCATNPLNDPSCTLTLCKSNEYLVNNLIRIEAVGLAQNSTYLDWEWVKISNNFNWNTVGANGSIRIQTSQTGPVVFKVRAKNACGWTPWLIQNYTVVNCPGPIASRMASETIYTVYPNPATDIVNISLRDQNNIPSTDTAVSGELVDMNGQTKTTVQINNNQATFSVAGLPMGIYVLNINVNGQIEGHQIAVE